MYENAPATKMLATHCACCSRPLVDAQSVETGVGPMCRQKHLVPDKVTGLARVEGNRLIHRIAKLQTGKEVTAAVARLKVLGFEHVVERINQRILRKRRPVVKIHYQSGRLFMKASVPHGLWNAWLGAMRSIPEMRYESASAGNSFPMSKKRSVYGLLCQYFPGQLGTGPKGDFIIGQTT